MSTYDIYLGPFGRTERPFSFGTVSAAAVTGLTKLAQAYVKALLTVQGSDLSDPAYGTELPSLIGSNVSDEATLQVQVTRAIGAAEEQTKARYKASNGEPELAKARVLAVTFSPAGALDIRVQLTATTGSVAAFDVPTLAVLSGQSARVTPTITTLGQLLQEL